MLQGQQNQFYKAIKITPSRYNNNYRLPYRLNLIQHTGSHNSHSCALHPFMFVINFDFSEYHSHFKFLLVNVPVLITELVTYPLQRVQTQLISKPYHEYLTKNQFNEARLMLRQMLAVEGFPKYLHGVRYALDYTVTQMTAKFFIFDWLMNIQQQPLGGNPSDNSQKVLRQNSSFSFLFWKRAQIYVKCLTANTLATVLSQSAFNYQVLASSLPINSRNRNETVKQKLLQYTKNKKVPFVGLKYTVPVALYNSVVEVLMIQQIGKFFRLNQNPDQRYAVQQFSTAILVLLTTGLAYHYAFLRQVELTMNLTEHSLPYSKGLLGTLVRHTVKGLGLYTLYYCWFEYSAKSAIQQFQEKSVRINELPSYRK